MKKIAAILLAIAVFVPSMSAANAPEPTVVIKTKRLGEQIFTRTDEYQFHTKPSDISLPKRKEPIKNFVGYYLVSSVACPTDEPIKIRYALKNLLRESPLIAQSGEVTPEKTFAVAQVGGYQDNAQIPDGLWDKILVTYTLENGKVLWKQEITIRVIKGEFDVEYKDVE